ncbi:hypothetical protein [Lawsonibacter celer]|jgi:hypothetical protein|uniref:hypothetical protein n=1 Tax=Lawsonibacter celer TaxID=2986526 RepID=UPI001645DD21|nr:hypothetical protein [Lawsonibacter celer]
MSQQARRNLTRLLSLVVAVLCMGLSIFAVRAGKGTQPEFQLGDFSGVSVEEKQKAFEESQSSEDLVELLKVLCYQAVVEENKAVEPLIVEYGTLLYDRARAEEVDLSTLGDDETMLELLRWIKSFGAK